MDENGGKELDWPVEPLRALARAEQPWASGYVLEIGVFGDAPGSTGLAPVDGILGSQTTKAGMGIAGVELGPVGGEAIHLTDCRRRLTDVQNKQRMSDLPVPGPAGRMEGHQRRPRPHSRRWRAIRPTRGTGRKAP